MGIDDSLKQAYLEGLRLSHNGASVSIHVGTEALNHLKTLAVTETEHQPWEPPSIASLSGFPIVHEPDEHPCSVVVSAQKVIA